MNVQLLYEILDERIIDIPALMFQVLSEFRYYTSMVCGMPFAFMITRFCLDAGVKLGPKEKWEKPTYGPFSTTTINRMIPMRSLKGKAVES